MGTAKRAGWRNKKVSGETTLTRMWLLSAVAVVLGVVGGVAAVALFKLISLMTHLTLLHDVGFDLPTLRDYRPDGWMVVTVVAGGLVVSLFAMWSPVIRGHGIPESLEAILGRDAKIRPRAAIAKPLSAAITIGTGGPFGAEGPIIVTGGSIGSLIGQLLAVSPAERKIMLATGAAAGMSATFNTPIAAVILAIELVLFERSLRAIVPLSIACGIAAAIHVVAFGSEPLFFVAAHLHVGLTHLPLFAVVGAASGLLAVVLNKGLFAMEAAFRRLPVNIFFWPAIGALGFGLIGLLVPRTLSMGYSAIIDTLNGRFTVTMLAVLFVAKLLSWWIALGSQTSGGTLAPMFLVGATMGCLLGHAVDAVWPGLHVSPAAFALVAMGATFGAATKALFAAVVFAMEVTGQYEMAIPLLVAAGVAELVAQALLSDRLMTEKLSHRGFRVEFRTVVDALRMRVVRQVMREAVTASAAETRAAASELMSAQGLAVVAVVDEQQRYLGLLRRGQCDASPDDPNGGDPAATVRSVVTSSIPPLDPDAYLATALEQFVCYGVGALPVVENGRVVGQLDRADVAAERHRCSTVLETRQAGWITGLRWRGRAVASGSAGMAAGVAGGKIIIPAGGVAGSPSARRPDRIGMQVGPMHQANQHQANQHQANQHQANQHHANQHQADRLQIAGSGAGIAGPRPGVAGGRLVPQPGRVEPRLGQFTLTERSRIVIAWDSAGAVAAAEYLAAALRPATGLRLAVSHGRAYRDDICLQLGRPAELPRAHDGQGYVLDVGMSGVTLTAATPHGLHNGVQTIRQLFPVWIASSTPVQRPWTMPSTHIVDGPRFGLRSVLLDLTGRVPTPETVRRLVDAIVAYKIDGLRMRLPAAHAERLVARTGEEPRAVDAAVDGGRPGAEWTANDYRDLCEYAAARFVAVMPEVAGARDVAGVGSARCAALTELLAAVAHPGPEASRSRPWDALRAVAMAAERTGHAASSVPLAPAGGPDAGGRVDAAGADGVAGLYRIGNAAAQRGGCGELGAVLPPLDVAEAADLERLLFPRLLAVAEQAWTPPGSDATVHGFLARVAPHGAKLALSGTCVDAAPGVPWRLEITGVRPAVRRRAASGRLAVLAAPGFDRETIDVEIDWGDGTSTAADLSGAARGVAGLGVAGLAGAAPERAVVDGLFDVSGSHSYRRPGTYLVAITATAIGTAPARTTVSVRVRGLRGSRPSGPHPDGEAPHARWPSAPESPGARPGRVQPVGEGERAGA